MIELLAFVLSVAILICFFVLCANTASMKKEMVKQNKLQTAILRKLESWNDKSGLRTSPTVLPFYLFVYDSQDRKLMIKNTTTGGYESLPRTSEHAISMTSKNADIQLEVIQQDGVINDLHVIKVNLKPVVDNLIDISDHLE